ncbi:hypothetical protein Tco_0282903 [Tanacetum coccineum]
MDVDNKGSCNNDVIDKDRGMKNKDGKSSKENDKKKMGKSVNRFVALSNEAEIKENLVWESMKERVDKACEKGLHINAEEKSSWNKDLKEYFKLKMHEYVKKQNVTYGKIYDEVYRDEIERIKELKLRKQFAEVEIFFKTGQILSIDELETWSDKKLEVYKDSIGDEAFEKTINQISADSNEGMDEEVAKDLSGNAQFISKNVVFNEIDEVLNHMQGLTAPPHLFK